MAKVICRYCKEPFDRDITPFMTEAVGKVVRYSHKSCFEKYGEIEQQRGQLWSYILEIHPSPNRPLIGRTINQFLEMGFTYEGIRLTLQYIKEVKKDDFSKAGGNISYVKYKYAEAQRYYESNKSLDAKTERIKNGSSRKANITTEVIIFKKRLKNNKNKFLPLIYEDEE